MIFGVSFSFSHHVSFSLPVYEADSPPALPIVVEDDSAAEEVLPPAATGDGNEAGHLQARLGVVQAAILELD